MAATVWIRKLGGPAGSAPGSRVKPKGAKGFDKFNDIFEYFRLSGPQRHYTDGAHLWQRSGEADGNEVPVRACVHACAAHML